MVPILKNLVSPFLVTVLCSATIISFGQEISLPDDNPKRPRQDDHSFANRPIARRLSGETEDVSFEDSVIRSMLQIVDIKFDTLSTRLLSLERGINNMQFYLSRQFNQVTKNLQAVNIVMNSLHGEISHVDIETRTVRNSIHALSKEFLDYRNRNTGVFGELPTHSIISGIEDDLQRKPPEIIHGNFVDKTHTYFPDNVDLEEAAEIFDNESYPLNLNQLQTYIEKGFKVLDDSMKTHVNNLLLNISAENQRNLSLANISSSHLNGNLIKSDAFKDINNRLEKLEASIVKTDNDHNTLVSRVKFINDHPQDRITTGSLSTGSPRLSKRSEAVDFKDEFSLIAEKLEFLSEKHDELEDYLFSTHHSLEVSKNNSERIVKLVEALSSSTIWIPHILHELNTWGKVLNESLSSTNMLYKELADSRSEIIPLVKSEEQDRSILSKLFDKKPAKSPTFIKTPPQHSSGKCEFNEKDLRMIQQQLSQVGELLETFLERKPDAKTTNVIHKGTETRVKLTKKETKRNSTAGIVSVKLGSNWQHVCYVESNSIPVATLVCQQLGFASGAPLIVPNWLPPNSSISMTNCQGKEQTLDHCTFETVKADNCKRVGLLGVACQWFR